MVTEHDGATNSFVAEEGGWSVKDWERGGHGNFMSPQHAALSKWSYPMGMDQWHALFTSIKSACCMELRGKVLSRVLNRICGQTPAAAYWCARKIFTPLYDQWTHTTVNDQWTHTTLWPTSSHHSTTSKLTPLYDQWSHITTLRPGNLHHSATL